jgi:CheY-like chemotaxis protein
MRPQPKESVNEPAILRWGEYPIAPKLPSGYIWQTIKQLKRMKSIELRTEEVSVALKESGAELNSVVEDGDPSGKSCQGPLCRLTPQRRASRRQSPGPGKKIYIVGDHPASCEVLRRILNKAKDLMVCGMASAADQALPAIARNKPQLVLMNFDFSGQGVRKLIKAIRMLDRSVKLLVISAVEEAHYAASVLRWGGNGYMVNEDDPEEIICAIHDVLEGHIYVSEEVMESNRRGLAKLEYPATEFAC